MSSEVVKKRGRPKKVISDPVEVEVPEATKKTTTRAKSTKAGPKTATAKASTSAKPPAAEKPISKPIASSVAAPKVAPKPSGVSTAAPPKPPVKTSVSPESSKILKGLREQSQKTTPPAAESTKLSKQTPTSTASKPPPSFTAQTKAPPPPTTTSAIHSKPSTKQASTPVKSTAASVKPIPKPHVPIAALNSEIVSNISTRAGARPNASQGNPLPKNYKSVANKVTMAIVAMPIAIVTSWVLYERLVLGEDRKHLVKPGMAMVETSPVSEGTGEGTPTPST